MATNKLPTLKKILPYVLVIGGGIGFIASFIITLEKMELLQNPAFVPSCDISPLISCGSVMITPQASAFVFPNPLLGIAGFAIVITIGMALLAKADFQRWFWLGLQGGVIAGLAFIIWLITQTLYVIGKLCPYCMVVWSIMIPIFIYTTLYNLQARHIVVPNKYDKLIDWLVRHHLDITLVAYIVVIGLVLIQFWDYWVTLI